VWHHGHAHNPSQLWLCPFARLHAPCPHNSPRLRVRGWELRNKPGTNIQPWKGNAHHGANTTQHHYTYRQRGRRAPTRTTYNPQPTTTTAQASLIVVRDGDGDGGGLLVTTTVARYCGRCEIEVCFSMCQGARDTMGLVTATRTMSIV
jgi:hypothetical protein